MSDAVTEPAARRPHDAQVAADGDRPTVGATSDRPRTARNAAIAVGIVVAALILLLAFSGGEDDGSNSALVGRRVPELTGVDLGGNTVDIDDFRGQWVVVNFFATWCPPCVAEHPELVTLSEWGTRRGDVQLLSVVFNEPDPEPVRRFFAERGGSWPVILDSTAAVDFQVAQIPETFVVTPAGEVAVHIPGQTTAEEVAAVIDSLENGTDLDREGDG